MRLVENNIKHNKLFILENKQNLCASIQYTIIEILMQKLNLAIQEHDVKNIAISGGVAANEEFRKSIKKLEKTHNTKVLIPKKEYSTDNGAMIAIAGYYKYQVGQFANMSINVDARSKLEYY